MRIFIIGCLCMLGFSLQVGAEVVVWDLPSCYPEDSRFKVKVDKMEVPVTSFTKLYSYCQSSFNKGVTVSVIVPEDIRSYHISPLVLGIKAEISGNQLQFVMEKPQYLMIQINELPVLVFVADSLETDIPCASGEGIYNICSSTYQADPTGTLLSTTALQLAIDDANQNGGGIVYVPKGIYLCGSLVLKSNVSLYLARGAVIRATGRQKDYRTFYTKRSLNMDGTWFIYTEENASGIKIYGRGTIDGNGLEMRLKDKFLNNILVPLACSGFVVDGITFRDSGLWNIIVTRSDNVRLENIKVFNENEVAHENDAIDVQESQNVIVKHVMAIAEDDTYSTKTWTENTDIAANWWGDPEPLENVLFDDCFGWSRCATFKIGFGVFQNQCNVRFDNCVSYKSMRAIAVNHRYGGQVVKDVVFSNIDIEGFMPRIGNECKWLDISVKAGGIVKNIVLENIVIRDFGKDPSVFSNVHGATLDSVSFKNIRLPDGRKASSLRDMNIEKSGNINHIQIQ